MEMMIGNQLQSRRNHQHFSDGQPSVTLVADHDSEIGREVLDSVNIDDRKMHVAPDLLAAPENGAIPVSNNKQRIKPFLILVACIAASGGFLYGLDLGGIGASFLMDGFRYHYQWACPDEESADFCTVKETSSIDREKSLISLFFGIGATLGSLLNTPFAERKGRRPCLIASTIVYSVGAMVQTWANTMSILWTGRFLTGTGVGMLSMVAPVYVSECAPAHIRGALGIYWDLATSFGIVVASAANIGLTEWESGWKFSYGSGLIVSTILLLSLLCFMPESPRWLAAHAQESRDSDREEASAVGETQSDVSSDYSDDLIRTLALLRYDQDIDRERDMLLSEVREKRELGEASWKEVFSDDNMMRRRVLLGFGFFAIQQLAGLSAVTFYGPDILNTFFSKDQAIMGMMGMTLLAFCSTIFTAVVIDKYGRTKVLVYGGIAIVLSLVVLSVFASLEETKQLGWAILAVCGVFNVASAFSWGPALWLVCSEMFPYRTRGKATSLTTMSHWLSATIVAAVFPAASTVSLAGCFAAFAVCMMFGTTVVYFLQVETTGKTFDEIDQAFLLHRPTLKRKDW